jgi:alpha-L-rhamnosidase
MPSTAPHDLSIDFGGDGFPVSDASPRLSWTSPIEAAGFELEAEVDEARLGIVPVAGERFVSWPWGELRSRNRARWRVRASGGEWSEWHRFEVGLLNEDWTAEWISPREGRTQPGRRPAHVLSTAFRVDAPVARARLYATALGVYEAFVDGVRVGTTELAPGSTSYDRTVYAQAHDVTTTVPQGDHRLELVVSDGWYRGQVGAFRAPAGWGDRLAVRAELHLDLEGDTATVIRSGPGWESRPSVITRADLMDGQTTDFTVNEEPSRPAVEAEGPFPPIGWSPAPPVRAVETRPAESIARLSDGSVVVDFGQNASGWIALGELGPRGTRTEIDYGEHIDAVGDLDLSHLAAVEPGKDPLPFVQHDEVVSSGTTGERFEPRHTVHGFRYVRLQRGDGAPIPSEASLPADWIRMRVVQTDLRRASSFECSDADLNRLLEAADWSFRGNAVDVPTDCPTRERLGWTGDYQVFAPTAARLYDVLGFTRKWLRSVRDDQLDDGRIANFSPDGRRVKLNPDSRFAMMTGSAGWGDAIVSVPWTMWTVYGDRSVLADNWDAMRRWVEWALRVARTQRHPSRIQRSPEPAPHEQYLWDASFHWGEWLEPAVRAADGTRVNPVHADPFAWFTADKSEVATAYLFRSTLRLGEIAEMLGRDEDAVRYCELAEHIRDAWRREFLDLRGRTVADTQAAYVRALTFGLIPQELRSAAAGRLVELIHEAGDHLATGFLSTADLLPVLADTGHADVAYSVLLQRTSPSWLGMLEAGATTIWEDWDGIADDGAARDSLNHYSKGAVVGFLHTHVLGLRQAEGDVGWERLEVAPVPGGGLAFARGHYDSPQGRVRVAWRLDGDELQVEAVLPAGTRGRIMFPNGDTVPVGPGRTVERRRSA